MKNEIKDIQERGFASTTVRADTPMFHSQGTGQASKTEKEQTFQQEEKVNQKWGKCDGVETGQESSETEKKEV